MQMNQPQVDHQKLAPVEVDRRKAPEGATHYQPGTSRYHERWFDFSDPTATKVFHGGRWKSSDVILADESPSRFVALPWTGKGRPPVGTLCIVTPHNTLWGFERVEENRCKVLAYQYEFVWLQLVHSDDSELFAFVTTRTDKADFAPVRTPEQLAADERLHEIRNALTTINTKVSFPNDLVRGNILAAAVEAMIDAGYRMQVAP